MATRGTRTQAATARQQTHGEQRKAQHALPGGLRMQRSVAARRRHGDAAQRVAPQRATPTCDGSIVRTTTP